MSFLEDRGEIRRYEGSLEVRNAFETGKLRRDFEECLERRARLRVADDLAERLASGLAAAMRNKEARAQETAEQCRAREAQEAMKRREEERERQKQEEEDRKRQQEREIEESRRAAIEERRRKRPEYIAQLLSMDLKKAPIKDIKEVMKKLELNPTGLPERSDLIAALKEGVPELRMNMQNPSAATAYATRPTMPTPSKENFDNMDHDMLQSVAGRIRNIDLQRAELHELKSLLSQAQLRVKDYPDRNSMIQALKHVLDAAQRTRNRSSYFGTVHQSNNLSAGTVTLIISCAKLLFCLDDTNITKIERRAQMAEKNVEELEDMRCQQSAQIEELQRSLTEKNQKIESLNVEVRRLEVQARNAELSGRNTAPKPVPRVCVGCVIYFIHVVLN